MTTPSLYFPLNGIHRDFGFGGQNGLHFIRIIFACVECWSWWEYFQEQLFFNCELSGLSAGLERVAEELMGRRKWALYQDVLTTTQPIPQQEQQEEQQSQCGENAAAAAEEPVTEHTQLENNSTGALIL